jgi:hypothetical protein
MTWILMLTFLSTAITLPISEFDTQQECQMVLDEWELSYANEVRGECTPSNQAPS